MNGNFFLLSAGIYIIIGSAVSVAVFFICFLLYAEILIQTLSLRIF